jgi:hypothetical protein
MVRAKFVCLSVARFAGSPVTAAVKLQAVASGSDENKTFWTYTPSGTIELSTINKDAAAQFEPGREYYIDFTEAAVSVA